MPSVPSVIAEAYDPDRFRADGHRLIDAIADALRRWQRRDGVVLPWRAPEDARATYARKPLDGDADLVDELRRIMAASTALAHPHCMGHQVAPPLPRAALAELVTAILANGMAVYDMGPASTPIELVLIEWMCGKLGLPAGAGGVFTNGGSLGNLTALLAMRQAHAGFDVWRDGAHAGQPLCVITATDNHYSITRAISIMGWGRGGAVAVDVDAKHRMKPEAAAAAITDARSRGMRVVGIVAAAGSTATGAFDPLQELAALAAQENVWLHVDAAHGGSVALSLGHRHKLAGIEMADSIVWDAHKLMMMPPLATAVLYKNYRHAYEAFAQRASYLFEDADPDRRWFDLGTRAMECTKRMMAIATWTTLRVQGEAWFGEVIDRLVVMAATLAAKIRDAPDFELALDPELNIVCYRYRPAGVEPGPTLDAHNRALRQRVLEDGRFYVVSIELPGGVYLRSAIMNPLVEPHDFDELLEHLRSLCPP